MRVGGGRLDQAGGDIGRGCDCFLRGRVGKVDHGAIAVFPQVKGEGVPADSHDVGRGEHRNVETFGQGRELAVPIEQQLLDLAERLLEQPAQQGGFAGAAVALDQKPAVDKPGEAEANGVAIAGMTEQDLAVGDLARRPGENDGCRRRRCRSAAALQGL